MLTSYILLEFVIDAASPAKGFMYWLFPIG